MGFDTLLGNQRLKDNLTATLRQGKMAHFYILSGPAGAGKGRLSRLLSAAMLCTGEDKPCCRCASCRKVLSGTHPDVISVTDAEHKNVAVKIVRQMRDDVFIRPNEGSRKIYIFPQELGIEGQNALLKVLEEPPSYGVFLLLTDNPEKILPTVRSRCVELPLQPLEPAVLTKALQQEFPQLPSTSIAAAVTRSGGFLGQARLLLQEGEAESPQIPAFVQALASRNALELTRVLVPMEKWKRDKLLPLLQQWLEIVEGALSARAGMPAVSVHAERLAASRSGADLNHAAQALKKCMEYAQSNVSCAAICSYLQWTLR